MIGGPLGGKNSNVGLFCSALLTKPPNLHPPSCNCMISHSTGSRGVTHYYYATILQCFTTEPHIRPAVISYSRHTALDTSAGLFRLGKGPSYIFHLDKDPRVCSRRSYSTLQISGTKITECWCGFNESENYVNGIHTIYARLDHDMDLGLFVKEQHRHRMSQLGSHQHSPTCHCQACSHPKIQYYA